MATAIITFTTPANNGGLPIDSYTVTSSPGALTATGPTSPISVTGLSASTEYTFTVTAHNAVGDSVSSIPSAPITTPAPAPTVPDAPTNVVAANV